MTLLDNLPHTASAYQRTRTTGTLGGSKDSFSTTIFTDRACWRQPLRDREIEEFNKRGIEATHKIYFVANPELDERHVLTIGGITYDVISRPEPDASVGFSVVWKVITRRKTTED